MEESLPEEKLLKPFIGQEIKVEYSINNKTRLIEGILRNVSCFSCEKCQTKHMSYQIDQLKNGVHLRLLYIEKETEFFCSKTTYKTLKIFDKNNQIYPSKSSKTL